MLTDVQCLMSQPDISVDESVIGRKTEKKSFMISRGTIFEN